MNERMPACFTREAARALPIHATRPAALPDLLASLPAHQAAYLSGCGFAAKAGQILLLPGDAGLPGVAAAVLGLGESDAPQLFGALPASLPPGTLWAFASGVPDPASAALGWGLGAYRFDRLSSTKPLASARLAVREIAGIDAICSALRAVWQARDLVNMPANLQAPAELAECTRDSLLRLGAHAEVITNGELQQRFPVLHAVGAGSSRPPAAMVARWINPEARDAAARNTPLISLCGKGVVFDSGGYDLKPSAGMLRMKKDMAGAAIAAGLASMIIESRLAVRLELRLGCVENMVSGHAMRPLDVLRTRRGVTIEVGNTDAEGRLVLCELLAEACEQQPAALLDFATLTGAARAALGPDLPALFSNDDVLAEKIVTAGRAAGDPVWRLPLWDGYNSWLDSTVADMSNVSEKAHAGAIVAALFLQRFVSPGTKWAHFDVYGWNDATRHGQPSGGECQAMRAAFEGIRSFVAATKC